MMQREKKGLKLFLVAISIVSIGLVTKKISPLLANESKQIQEETSDSNTDLTAVGELRMPQESKSSITLASRMLELTNDGWRTMTENIPSYLTLNNGDQLRYYFGGKMDIAQNDNTGIAPGLPITKGTNRLKIPNVDYIDRSNGTGKEEIVPHLYLNSNLNAPQSVYTSQGLIVATQENGKRKSSIMYNQPSSFQLMEKTINGLTAKKLVYIAGYHDSIYNPNLLVETTMTGLPIGRIKIDQKVTNISSVAYPNFMLGYSEDTKLGNDVKADEVPVIAIGNRRGFYIRHETATTNYRLSYFVSDQDYAGIKGPDNWRGGRWTKYSDLQASTSDPARGGWTGDVTFFNSTLPTPLKAWGAFADITDSGDEMKDWKVDEIIMQGEDSAVSYKNQPITLNSQGSTGFSWGLGMDSEADGPEVQVNEKELLVEQGQPAVINGNWRDMNSQEVSLYYKLNGGNQVVIQENSPNNDLNIWHNFTKMIQPDQLSIGDNTVEVYAINKDGKNSSIETVTVKVKSKVAIVYKDVSGKLIDPLPTSIPTTLSGLVGEKFELTLPDLGTDYQFVETTGATVENGKIVGKYLATNTVVTMVYQVVEKQVTMTINYRLNGTDKSLKNILDNNSAVLSKSEVVTIGSEINHYLGKYETLFTGYTYNNTSGNVGKVPNTDFVVTLFYEGGLSLDKVPSNISFGTHDLISFGTKHIKPTDNLSIKVLDTMERAVAWNLQLRISQPLATAANKKFKGELKFKTAQSDIKLNDKGQMIALKKGDTIGYETVTWDKSKEGLYLVQESGNSKDTYTGSLEWTLTDGK